VAPPPSKEPVEELNLLAKLTALGLLVAAASAFRAVKRRLG
jgi:hypothetical protein